MIEWSDVGFVLSARPHGEGGAVVQLLTREHGRHAGLVRGGGSRRRAGQLEVGNTVRAVWRARLADHLGAYECETVANNAAHWIEDRVRLIAIAAACATAEATLPEREPHPGAYEGLDALIGLLGSPVWPAAYVRWEIGLLAELGYGLDLDRCAVTGARQELVYVSPRSGRAVSAEAGEPWKDRLFPLPGFLVGQGEPTPAAVRDGLALTAHFLRRNVLGPADRDLPAVRLRLYDCFDEDPKI
jgi:DNA repair protein RecO (recombination protein O)